MNKAVTLLILAACKSMPYQGPDIQLTATQGQATFKHVDAKCKTDRPSLTQLSQLPIFEDLAAQAASIEQALERARQQHLQPTDPADALESLLGSEDAKAAEEANAVAESTMEGFGDFQDSGAPKKGGNKRKGIAKAAAMPLAAGAGQSAAEDAASHVSSLGRKASKKDSAQQEALDSMDSEMKRVALAHLGSGKGTGFKCLQNLQISLFFGLDHQEKSQALCIPSVPLVALHH